MAYKLKKQTLTLSTVFAGLRIRLNPGLDPDLDKIIDRYESWILDPVYFFGNFKIIKRGETLLKNILSRQKWLSMSRAIPVNNFELYFI